MSAQKESGGAGKSGLDHVFGLGVTLGDLYRREGLERVDGLFLTHLGSADSNLRAKLEAGRSDPSSVSRKDESDLLMAVAPHLSDFVGKLFGIESEVRTMAENYHDLAPLYSCKRLFVQRRALKAHGPEWAKDFDGPDLRGKVEALLGQPFDEMVFARKVNAWLEDDKANADALDVCARFAAWAVTSKGGHSLREHGVLFKIPGKTDPQHLVEYADDQHHGLHCLRQPEHLGIRRREGFDLTDEGYPRAGGLDEANYCIFCHHQGKDSCSTGMKDKKSGAWAVSALGRTMTGCPLEERISEFQETMTHGIVIGSLSLITLDNPMCAGTGHRICNDCMVGCIYNNQNRTTVNIPQAETRVVKDVLSLPYGFEIYSLLTRWNPMNLRRPLPKPDTGRKVLVVGLGPAGYTLAHHLMNDGHTVAAVDGLKLEPLDQTLTGVTPLGERVPFNAVRNAADLWEPLGSRVLAGFGGVAEYGITVRWDKNFLKVIRIMLQRRQELAMIGGVRMGGTITVDSAFEMGFDHIALCSGAGKPTIVPMANGLVRGVRQASDFLMALQLTGAARKDTVANLQIRLPVVVIGGGLTAIDTATEALAYYTIQVEKFLLRYEALVAEKGEEAVRASYNEEEAAIADEFLLHGRVIRAERAAAAAEHRPARILELLDGWGGSTMAYRRKMLDSPAYKNNPEEVVKALEEGIRIVEGAAPVSVELDKFGHAAAIKVKKDGHEVVIPARSIIVAAGTVPNITLAAEDPAIKLDGKYFQAVDDGGNPISPERVNKPATPQVMTHIRADGSSVSFFGDQHPSWAGNVVAAMASAKQGYPAISRQLAKKKPASTLSGPELFQKLNGLLRPVVHAVNRLTPTISEVVVRAPLAAKMFKPGQFYRLQNYEMFAKKVDGTSLAMEGLALTGAWTDVDKGLLSMIVLDMGGSSNLVDLLEPGEPVIVMGPTGEPTHTPEKSTVLLAGGGLGNAVLFSIGRAFRENGSRVLYFGAYKTVADRYKIDEIKAAADVLVWCCDEAPGFTPDRPQDKAFVGNVVQAMQAYAEGKLGDTPIPMKEVDRIIAIGSDGMMNAVGQARHGVLAPYLNPDHVGLASINSPMQCMMKEICAQCLQNHHDPKTGEEYVVFSCFNQDQELDRVDFKNLRQRLGQQTTQEKLTKQWIARSKARL
ncbi:MAG: FAD-dependent oxidoreductase [Alphaproteobacteria bacterium]|nr:FAD-dependent oxidoreductase [Alphaproteobacteria bacterium]